MYKADCNNDTLNILDIHMQQQLQQQEVIPNPVPENYFDTLVKWFESIFGLTLWSKFI